MKTPLCSLGKVCGWAYCFLFCATSGLFASEIALQKVPLNTTQVLASRAQSRLGPQATFALINYSVRDAQAKAPALYVSSGNDLTQASSMIDDQIATSFGFLAEDKSPTAVIDLGRICKVRRLSTVYSARPGSIDFYVMESLPGTGGDESGGTVKLESSALTGLKPVGSTIDDGTQGRATVNFAATSGRYVMLRWIPAAQGDTAFTVAEVTAFGPGGGSLLASNGRFSSSSQTTSERTIATDAKDVPDSKDVSDSKDIPEEAPVAGPPGLPQSPLFTFIPYLVPVIPPTGPPPVIDPHSL